jgi:hypothetical protein
MPEDKRTRMQRAVAALSQAFGADGALDRETIRELDRAIDRYLTLLEIHYRYRPRKPYRESTREDAHREIDEISDERHECIEARRALASTILRSHGIDPDEHEWDMTGHLARTNDCIVFAHGHIDPGISGSSENMGLYTDISISIIPVTEALTLRIAALPDYDPSWDERDQQDD